MFIRPRLCTSLRDPSRLDDPRYMAEPKFDGQRAQVHVAGRRTVETYSRAPYHFSATPDSRGSATCDGPSPKAILDGEVCGDTGSDGILHIRYTEPRGGLGMQPQDVTRVLSDPLAQELMQSSIPARLAYLGPDGFPRAIPMGFHWDGVQFVLCTVPHAPKVSALKANPKVAFTVDTNAFPPHVLLVRGTAAIDIVDGVPPEYLAASRKSVGPDQWDAFETQVRAMYKRMARIKITPLWAKLLDFQTRFPTPIEKLIRRAS